MTVHYFGLGKAAEAAAAQDQAQTSLRERAKMVCDIAARHAEDVDVKARFPEEAIQAAKDHGLIGAMVGSEYGGEGASISAFSEVCYLLGRACSSTAMIFAMHQIKAACLVRHVGEDAWVQAFLRRVAAEQLLLASSTTEGKGGGNVRSSEAPIERDGATIRLTRAATVMSYGAQADAVVTTARRDADAGPADQVLVIFPRETYRLTPSLAWETLGMRGTCSAGFNFEAAGEAGMVMSQPYAEIHAQTMTPTAHILWGSVWAGISAAAVERARMYLRKAQRASGGALPPSAHYFLKAQASLKTIRALLAAALHRYEAAKDDPTALARIDFQTTITTLKVDISEAAQDCVLAAMRTCGLTGYRNDGDASIGRHLRDILAAPIMINNDRILADLGASAILSETPDFIVA
jgi:acyl-CoA dehydrogenase